MRASKNPSGKTGRDIHISGAEGLYDEADIAIAGANYIVRAKEHPRGMPDTIVVTLEKVKTRPVRAPLLDISAEDCGDPGSAWDTICSHLSKLGISKRALANARKILLSKNTIRGAALMSAEKGLRLDPDRKRGVRVSRLGMDKASGKRLFKKIASPGTDIQTVMEALVLASKVTSCKSVVAEICISDDPDYTTGYVASRSGGYVRIPNIKRHGESHGGRVFFLCEGGDIAKIIHYLEKTAVIIEDRKQ